MREYSSQEKQKPLRLAGMDLYLKALLKEFGALKLAQITTLKIQEAQSGKR